MNEIKFNIEQFNIIGTINFPTTDNSQAMKIKTYYNVN